MRHLHVTSARGRLYTAEVARAVGVPLDVPGVCAASGETASVAGHRAVLRRRRRRRTGPALRALAAIDQPSNVFTGSYSGDSRNVARRGRMPLLASLTAHALLAGVILWVTAGATRRPRRLLTRNRRKWCF